MDNDRHFMIYAITCTLLVLVVGIGGGFAIALSNLPAGMEDEFWATFTPSPLMATGEVALGLLVRGFSDFFLPGGSYRWSLAGVGA